MKTIQCPSCGAHATNFLNCEYCSSLFVRSSAHGYNPENINSIFYFNSLAEALEQNLKYQQNLDSINDKDVTTTTIYLNKDAFLEGHDAIIQCPNSNFIASCFSHVPNSPSIAVDFAPELFTPEEFERLKRVDEIKFFSTYKSLSGENGYVMDFGNDSIGAAKIISKILVEIKNIGHGTPLFCLTEPAFNKDALDRWVDGIEDQEVKNFISQRIKNASTKSNCFIATATMGDINHPVVVDLRRFRDNWLLQRKWGIQFVEQYYKYSPKVARHIKNSNYMKRLAFYLLIQPLWKITRKIERDNC